MKKEFSAIVQVTMLSLFASLVMLAKIPKWKRYYDKELTALQRQAKITKPTVRRKESFLEKARKAAAARARKLLNDFNNRPRKPRSSF